jgi:hypothetical protein
MKKYQFKLTFLLVATALVTSSCTDLEVSETDSIITLTNADGTTFNGVENPQSALDNAYNNIRSYWDTQENQYALSEVTTDEFIIPTRGTDWGDNGLWRVLHQHSWTFEHQFINNTWNNWNTLQLLASEIIDPKSNASVQQIAEAKFIRAYSQWYILDFWGIVPVRDLSLPPSELPEVLDASTALEGIVQDLNDAIADLAEVGPGVDTERANKSIARFLLAKVLLNKHIYNGSGTADSADMDQVISLVDAITAEGYALQAGYFDLFRNQSNTETIFSTPASNGSRMWNTLHYNLGNDLGAGGGWNGFSTLAEFYDSFEGDSEVNTPGSGQEERRGFVPLSGLAAGAEGTSDGNNDGFADGSNVGYGFLIGQQYALDGTPLTDRNDDPLSFTRNFVDGTGQQNLQNNGETTGIRVIKYNPRFGDFVPHQVLFRYADAYLMKAEAMMRKGNDVTAMVNELRELRQATPLGTVTEADLLAERGRELFAEGWRRNDLIRFGQYTRDWVFKESTSVGDETKHLFPIPAAQLITNPNLVQNPGY